MTSKPYIQHSSFFFVPVVRYQLAFSVMVQRAVADLQLDKCDFVAVEMPDSAQQFIMEGIARLPRISLVISSDVDSKNDMGVREAIAVTPCDGVIEALRIARERNIFAACIDQTLSPQYFLDRHCIMDPAWPDDGLAVELGAQAYLELIRPHLCHPPARVDPIDTWRERYMVDQLRRLQVFARRVLVVCDAAHVDPIRALLRESSTSSFVDGSFLPPSSVRYELREPNLEYLLFYLGDIPKLVEVYEQYRATNRAVEFDKYRVLLQVIHELSAEAHDMNFSVRRLQAFSQFVRKMVEIEGRVSPGLEQLVFACQSCFNKPFSLRVFRHLLNYFGQVRTTRVGRKFDTKNEVFVIEARVRDTGKIFVGRGCNPAVRKYEIKSSQEPERLNSTDNSIAWPLCDRFTDGMRMKAYSLSKKRRTKQQSLKFRGSLECGVDLRRTLRSCLSPDPALYVKHQRYNREQIVKADHEPIVWLFDLTETESEKWEFGIGVGGSRRGPSLVLDWRYSAKKITGYQDETVLVKYERNKGLVTFCDLTASANYLEGVDGVLIEERVPKVKDFEYFSFKDGEAYGPYQIADIVSENTSWWEVLLVGAMEYADKYVICVAPDGFVIPPSILAMATSRCKSFRQLRTAMFNEEEKRKLQIQYWISGRWNQPDDSNDPKFHAYIIDRYSDVMSQFWDV